MSHREAYRVLELTEGQPLPEVKAQYRRLAKLWHPDKNKSAEASAHMVRINLAYDVLCQFFSTPFTGFTMHDSGQGFGEGGFGGYGRRYHSDTFNDADPFGGSRPDHDEPLYAKRGRHITRKTKITLYEAVFGCKRTLQGEVTDLCTHCGGAGHIGQPQMCAECGGRGRLFEGFLNKYRTSDMRCTKCEGTGFRSARCPNCNGSGQGASRKWSEQVTIPPGAFHQGFLRMQGKGGRSSNMHLHGDLILTIEIIEHPLFMTSTQDDVLERDAIGVVVPVSFWTWILGGEVVVPLLQGSRVVTFAARADLISIPGEGLPCARDPSKRGNLIVELLPCADTTLSPEHRRMVEQMAKEQQNGQLIQWSHAMRDWTFGSTESRFGEAIPKKSPTRKKPGRTG